MKTSSCVTAGSVVVGVCLMACRRVETTPQPEKADVAVASANSEPGPDSEGPVPKTLDGALELMSARLTADERKLIEASGDDYATEVHFGAGGMGMRNSWGLWGDSPLTRHFQRLGIYHADDMSSIINTAFSRKVRCQPIRLEELVAYHRNYWEKEDIVAPQDLNCATCGKEMFVETAEGASPSHPNRWYFRGACPNGHHFYYYHKDGWTSGSAIGAVEELLEPEQPAQK